MKSKPKDKLIHCILLWALLVVGFRGLFVGIAEQVIK
jgi:hypothetical protein